MFDLKSSVQSQFDRVAANYRTSAVHARGEEFNQMLALAHLRGDERVLDAGCGAGHTAIAFAPHVASVVALDFTQSMLGQVAQLAAEKGIANVEPRLGDVEHLPFGDGVFDLIASRYSAHHWPHPQQAVQEFRRVLKEGGQVLLADVVGFDDPTCDTFLNAVELLRDPSHVRDFTPAEWITFFQKAGFEAEIRYRWDLYLDFESWTQRMATPALNVQAIRQLLAAAPSEVRAALKVTAEGFWFRCAVIEGKRMNKE
ncbi:MAG: methyltransferase domain-containing protein [Caldilineaceae bacterium]|nr:methyltransferase domain-containing protein [Caldilineaceae bacterium]